MNIKLWARICGLGLLLGAMYLALVGRDISLSFMTMLFVILVVLTEKSEADK